MKPTVKQKLSIGAFTLIGILIFFVMIFVIGSKRNLFTDTFAINTMFKNIGGLQIGNNVRLSGIDVGTVSAIVIVNDSTVRVTLQVKEKVHHFIKTDAVTSIGSDGLMGDKLINISPGPVGDKVLPSDGSLATVPPVEFDKIIGKVSRIADNAEVITASLAGISTQISSGKGSLGRLIYTDTLEAGLEKTVKSAQQTISTVHATISTAKEGVQGFKDNMEAMKHNFLVRGYYKKKERRKQEKLEEKQRQHVADSMARHK